jgi:predicted nuclease of predicted toxin-antitoxin system
LLDVNVGSRIADALAAAGHDVVRMALTNDTAIDSEILDLAVYGERVLVTYDRDFSELVFGRLAPTPPAIIYLRFQTHEVDAALNALMSALDFDQLKGHLTVIDQRQSRRAPFPVANDRN